MPNPKKLEIVPGTVTAAPPYCRFRVFATPRHVEPAGLPVVPSIWWVVTDAETIRRSSPDGEVQRFKSRSMALALMARLARAAGASVDRYIATRDGSDSWPDPWPERSANLARDHCALTTDTLREQRASLQDRVDEIDAIVAGAEESADEIARQESFGRDSRGGVDSGEIAVADRAGKVRP